MGAEIAEEHGLIVCETCGRLHGAEIALSFPSVGATENTIIAASVAQGRTVLTGAAREPEIVELAEMINAMGGRVRGAGGDVIVIDGVEALGDCEHTCIPDRIAAATYISAAAVTGSELTLRGVRREHMVSVISVFEQAGCRFSYGHGELTVYAPPRLDAVSDIRTMPYPGFPTDAQAVVAAALATACGTSMITETVFGNRFGYMCELARMGADVRVDGRIAVIRGVKSLCGAETECTDLRGGAALVVAALGANGRSTVRSLHHIDRGYESMEAEFSALGAKIYRNVTDETEFTEKCFR